MMTEIISKIIKNNLLSILREIEKQNYLAETYSKEELSFDDEMFQLFEYIDVADEYAVAYESIISTLENHKYILSGIAAVKLLEVGLLMKYKTEREEDKIFDNRRQK